MAVMLQAAEVASQIHQRHDLGTKVTSELITIDEEKWSTSQAVVQFWTALGAQDICPAKGCVTLVRFFICWIELWLCGVAVGCRTCDQ